MSPAGDGPWQVEFHADGTVEPARDWLDSLRDGTKRNAVIAAGEHILVLEGIDVCASEWGRNLGGGLYELRIRHSASEIRRIRAGVEGLDAEKDALGEVLLRLYFTTAPGRRILLIGGYDKGRFGAGGRQQGSVAAARQAVERIRRERRRTTRRG
jgi:hypothetical protein